jgi:hypothetical protein
VVSSTTGRLVASTAGATGSVVALAQRSAPGSNNQQHVKICNLRDISSSPEVINYIDFFETKRILLTLYFIEKWCKGFVNNWLID